jgi:SH3-like domain-containing protein
LARNLAQLMPQDATMARFALLGLFCLVLAGADAWASAPRIGPDSGKLVPRFESLKYGEVNGRQGPSMAHRILWTYHRRGLPVEIVAESGPWRRVRDPDGDLAWVSSGALEDRRTVFVAAPAALALRKDPRDGARPVAFLAPGVVGELQGCQDDWRAVRIGSRQGWAPKASLWGADVCPGDASTIP